MEMQTELAVGSFQQALNKVYERNNGRIQSKLQQLYSCLGRISKLDTTKGHSVSLVIVSIVL